MKRDCNRSAKFIGKEFSHRETEWERERVNAIMKCIFIHCRTVIPIGIILCILECILHAIQLTKRVRFHVCASPITIAEYSPEATSHHFPSPIFIVSSFMLFSLHVRHGQTIDQWYKKIGFPAANSGRANSSGEYSAIVIRLQRPSG